MENTYNCIVSCDDELSVKDIYDGYGRDLGISIKQRGKGKNIVFLNRESVIALRDDLNKFIKDTEVKISKEFVFGSTLVVAELKVDEIVKNLPKGEAILSRTRDTLKTNLRTITILATIPYIARGYIADKIYIDNRITTRVFDDVIYPLIHDSKTRNNGQLDISYYSI